MSIEIRQMVVKSNVLQRREADEKDSAQNYGESKKVILEECKKLIVETLKEMKER